METKLCRLSHAAHFLYDSSTLNIIRKQFLNCLNSFRDNDYVFSMSPGKTRKGSKLFGENINLYCLPHTGLRIRLNFATVSAACEIRWHNHSKKGEGKGEKIKYRDIKQNSWYLLRKTTIQITSVQTATLSQPDK